MEKRLDEKIAEKIRDDKLDHRLVMSKYYLNKIKGRFDLNGGWDHFYFMTNFESFIFFASNAIEIITHEINDEFSLLKNNVTIYAIKDKLNELDQRQKQIVDIISEYFKSPDQNSSHDTYSNSSLWCLREIRNIIAHGKFLIRTVSSGSTYYGFVIPYPIRNKKYQIIGIDRIEIRNTDEYFEWLYRNLETFAEEIRKIIPKKYHSSQHKHHLDFEL